MPPPLEGLLVADFSRILAGPLCTMLLADAGARVIKIEETGRGDETRRWGPPFAEGESGYFLSVNRNKESITLNLKTAEGRKIARELIARADVVVENFRPDHRKAFGLTPAAVHRVNKRAVLCSIAGFDSDGPDAELPGYDLLAQAAGGLMSITGEPKGDPIKVGVALSDVLTAHYAYGAICTSLYAREQSGKGEALEVSLFSSTVASLINVAQGFLLTKSRPQRYGNAHPSIVPYQAFEAQDRLFVLAVASDRHFELLCRQVLGDDPLADDPRFKTNALRVTNRKTLIPRLQKILRKRTAAEWVARCRSLGIPAAPVQSLDELFSSEVPIVEKINHPAIGTYEAVGYPVRRNGKRTRTRNAPPLLGADTDAVLRELGYSKKEIAALRAWGVV